MKKAQNICVGVVVFLGFIFILYAQDPAITNQPASRALWAGGNVTFAVGVSNAGSFTYQWLFNGTNLPNAIITTVAGNGNGGFSGDGGAATNAKLKTPSDVFVDAFGNLFISDVGNQRIRKVDTNGIITTLAGTGSSGFSGDGGSATNAKLASPANVAVDAAGNVFISDIGNQRLRVVATNGIITTFLSVSSAGLVFDAVGNLFFTDIAGQNVDKFDTNSVQSRVAGKGIGLVGYSGDGGAATNAAMNNPMDIVFDNKGNLFIADEGNYRIRKVDTTGIITTYAGNGHTSIPLGDGGQATNAAMWPLGVLVDSAGSLLIADDGNEQIRRVDTNGIITTAVGNGVFGYSGDGDFATNAELNTPQGMALDASGNIFIADRDNNRIRKVANTQGPILALNDVGTANTGSYQVVVTGANGSLTSSIVNLIVTATPLIYKTTLNPDSSVSLSFVSQPGTTNVVLCATNLAPPVLWQTISTNLTNPDGTWRFTDTNAAGNKYLFYRSLTQ